MRNWCFQTVVLEKTLDSPLDSKEIKPVNAKVNSGQPWIFTGRTDAQTEAPILWPPDVNSRVTRKDAGKEFPDAGKDWGQEEKGTTEDDTVGWHHQLSGHEFEQTLWDSEGQGSLACCSSSLTWLSNWTTTMRKYALLKSQTCYWVLFWLINHYSVIRYLTN